MHGGFLNILKENDFVIRNKFFIGEIDDFAVYNKKIHLYSDEFINYLEYPYREEVEQVLKVYYGKEVIDLFIKELEREEKIILKKIFI